MKKSLLKLSVLASLAVVFLTSCYRDNEEEFYQNVICDTAAVSYANKVSPIFASKCYDCHSAATAVINGGGFNFDGYSALNAYLSGTPKLMNALRRDGTVSDMPQGKPKLDDCSINTIQAWINQGKQNN